MTRIVLIRHAKAEAPRPGLDDHDRALTLEGRTSATGLATSLADAGVEISSAISSSAVRTQQTWKLMAGAFPDAATAIEPLLYETNVSGVISVLRSSGATGTVAVIGHEPTISAAAAWLAGPGSDTKSLQRVSLGMPTGTAAVLEFDGTIDQLEAHGATLTAICASSAHF